MLAEKLEHHWKPNYIVKNSNAYFPKSNVKET